MRPLQMVREALYIVTFKDENAKACQQPEEFTKQRNLGVGKGPCD